MPNFTSHFENLPSSLQAVVRFIASELRPECVLLFGSRARGNHRPNSDFDLAVFKRDLDARAWARVLTTIDEEPMTLHKIDIVHYEAMDEGYRRNINQEGVGLYV